MVWNKEHQIEAVLNFLCQRSLVIGITLLKGQDSIFQQNGPLDVNHVECSS